MSQGNFFAVGKEQFKKACTLGIRPAVAFLVMARGTLKDNATTSWSAQSVFIYTGMAWRRATEAIEALVDNNLVEVLKAGKKPRYKLTKPKDVEDLIWLPNTLVDGAGKESPPIRRLRERGELDLLQKFIELYSIHDLTSDGGLPRTLVRVDYERVRIAPHGPFVIYGFTGANATATSVGLLSSYTNVKDDNGNKGAWVILKPLCDMGLIDRVEYMVESSDYEAEFLYPLNAETKEAMSFLSAGLAVSGGDGFARQIDRYWPLVGLAVKELISPTLVGVFRLHYRPKTAKTTVWYATEQGQTERFVEGINKLYGIESAPNVDINGFQVSSREINGHQ